MPKFNFKNYTRLKITSSRANKMGFAILKRTKVGTYILHIININIIFINKFSYSMYGQHWIPNRS